ncbi:MAG: hypothetical protein J5825_09135 [Lachnospiraceae bacterium]|nr:hypothetical protein [Lachnospiraceae bacterium]
MARPKKSNLNFKPEAPTSIISLVIFGAETAVLAGCYLVSLLHHGESSVILGIVLLCCGLASIGGVLTAVNALLRPDKAHSLAVTGLVLNSLFLLAVIGLYILGALHYNGPLS